MFINFQLLLNKFKMEGYDMDEEKEPHLSLDICCPKCQSKDITLGETKIEGFFWVEKCNNCGYHGKSGDKVGCMNKDSQF